MMRRMTVLLASAAALALASFAGSEAPAGAPAVQSAPPLAESIDSAILGRTRRIEISFPPSFPRTTRRYPVIVVLDGAENFADATLIATTLAELGHIPESIVVAVHNATSDPKDRVHDMTPPGLSVSGSTRSEGGDRFLDFIEREVLALVAAKHRGGRPHVLVGHSSGGVIATYAAATRPAFPVVVSIDAPVHLDDDWLAKRLIERARRPAAAPVRYVSVEAGLGWSDRIWAELETAAPKGWIVRREKLAGESHESMGFLGMYQGLKFAFGDFSVVGAPIPPRAPAMAAFDHYRAFEKEFDAELPPPAPVLRRLVEDLLTEGQVEPARRALAWMLEGYGEGSERARLEATIVEAAGRLPLKETVADLKAAPRPSPDDIAPYLGVWRGKSWINDETQWELTVRFRVEEGRAVVEHLFPREDGSAVWRPYEYVKRLPDGIEFGVMNGMRPLGLLVLTGRLAGDVLEGEESFRGILIPLPGGHTPPVVKFRIERQSK